MAIDISKVRKDTILPSWKGYEPTAFELACAELSLSNLRAKVFLFKTVIQQGDLQTGREVIFVLETLFATGYRQDDFTAQFPTEKGVISTPVVSRWRRGEHLCAVTGKREPLYNASNVIGKAIYVMNEIVRIGSERLEAAKKKMLDSDVKRAAALVRQSTNAKLQI